MLESQYLIASISGEKVNLEEVRNDIEDLDENQYKILVGKTVIETLDGDVKSESIDELRLYEDESATGEQDHDIYVREDEMGVRQGVQIYDDLREMMDENYPFSVEHF